MAFAPSIFRALSVGLLFGQVSLGPPFAKAQKMGDLGVLAEFVITRLFGRLWSRRFAEKLSDECTISAY